MTQRTPLARLLATVLIVAIQAVVIPVAADEPASLTGAVVASTDAAPMAGVRVHAGDPATGEVFTSSPSAADGSFTIDGLPASTYELAVERDGGLYLVGTPVRLAPGQARQVNVSVNAEMAPDPGTSKQKRGGGVWNNPLTAALIVLGSAVVLGIGIEQLTDDDNETNASPSN